MFNGCHAESMGKRPKMEDSSTIIGEFVGPNSQFYGMFDGHGGNEVSLFLAHNLPNIIMKKYNESESMNQAIRDACFEINPITIDKYPYAGSTAAIVVILDDIIYTANVGDTRIILIENGVATRLSYDHVATDPLERRSIQSKGGAIINDRVNGSLMLSRAFGDGQFADVITCQPYMNEIPRNDDMRLIIACDGVWDVMDDQYAADIFARCNDTGTASRTIKDEALARGSTDNVSVICVELKPK